MAERSLRALTPARAVWAVAWPVAAMGVLRSFYYLTDSYWVGRMGPEPLAALGGSAFAWWMIALTCELPAVGALAQAARHEGAGERARIGVTAASSAAVGLAVAVGLAALWPARGVYFDLLGFATGTAERTHGMDYVGASLLGASSLALSATVGGVLRGLGDTRSALALTAAALALNAALDPLLIWGGGPVAAMGIAGAAWATAIANAVAAILGGAVLFLRGVRPARPSLSAALTVAWIGAPVSGSRLGFAMVYVALGRVIASFGPEQMAALGLGHRIEGVAYFVCEAFGVGAATMVGQHLGAGDGARARASARAAAQLGLAVMVPATVVLGLFAEPLFRLFTDDPATVQAGTLYLRAQALVLAAMALEEVYRGAFTGSGRTLLAAALSFGLTAARVPAAFLLSGPLGIAGVWLAIAGSTALKGASLYVAWRLSPDGPRDDAGDPR